MREIFKSMAGMSLATGVMLAGLAMSYMDASRPMKINPEGDEALTCENAVRDAKENKGADRLSADIVFERALTMNGNRVCTYIDVQGVTHKINTRTNQPVF